VEFIVFLGAVAEVTRSVYRDFHDTPPVPARQGRGLLYRERRAGTRGSSAGRTGGFSCPGRRV